MPMVVVGNKIDLEDEREVSTEEARAYAQSIRCGFVEVSAKENINVEQPFHEVVRLIRFQQRAAAGDQPPMARPVSDGGPTAVASGGQSSVSNEAYAPSPSARAQSNWA